MPKHATFAITTANPVLHPFHADRGPRDLQGLNLGILTSGEPFFFDPFEAYRLGITTGLSRVIFGEIGRRKSTQIKAEIMRNQMTRRSQRYLVFDYKFEYDRLCEALGINPLTFGEFKINPIDPTRLNRGQQQAILAIMVQIARESFKPLPDLEYPALNVALREAASLTDEPTIVTVRDALVNPTEEGAASVHMSRERLKEEGLRLAMALNRFIGDGDLGGVFDGPTSPGFDLSGDVVVMNFSTIDEAMRPLLVSVVASWLEAAWQKGDESLLFDHVIFEECWEYLRHLMFARWARKGAKLHRARGVAYTYVLHRLSDLMSAGTADSEQVRLAEGLVADAQIAMLFRQPVEERDNLRRIFGLTEIQLDIVTKILRKGQALWVYGDQAHVVSQVLSGVELHVVRTDDGIERNYLKTQIEAGFTPALR